MTARPKRRRWRALLKVLAVVLILVGVAALVSTAFQLGMTQGLATAGGVLVVYAVPATILDWPRLTFEDVISALGAILAAVGTFFLALFDW